MINKRHLLEQVLDGLMRRYQERVPDVSAILGSLDIVFGEVDR